MDRVIFVSNIHILLNSIIYLDNSYLEVLEVDILSKWINIKDDLWKIQKTKD